MRGKTKGEWLLASQEVQLTDELLSGPKTQQELIERLSTTERRINGILYRLLSYHAVYFQDGKWNIRREDIEDGEDHREDETTQL